MITVNIKTVEKFRRYLLDIPGNDEQSLLDTVRRTFTADGTTEFRMAVTDILLRRQVFFDIPPGAKEKNIPYWVYRPLLGVKVGILSTQAKVLFAYRKAHPGTTNNVNLSKVYPTRHGLIKVYGTIPAISGMELYDPRPALGNTDIVHLMDDLKWSFLLDATGGSVYHYDIFRVSEFHKTLPLPDGRMLFGDVVIEDPVRYSMMRYLDMAAPIIEYLNEFLDWVDAREMWGHLTGGKEKMTA
jgi:hypothetical protein